MLRRLALFLLTTSLALAAVAPGTARAQSSASTSALSEMVAKVQVFTLKNGLTVILYNRGEAPVFAGAVVVRVGGSDEVAGETGISHLFEHMAFKGTSDVGTNSYSRERRLLAKLEEIAAESRAGQEMTPEQKKEWDEAHEELRKLWIPDDFTRRYDKRGATGQNATTDKEFTKYFVNLPRSAFEFWCRMESDRLIDPVMRQFYQERDVVLEERRMRFEDDPGGRLYELLLGVAYQRHPYRAPVIGYEQDIRSLTATQLEAFRKKYYVPSNMVVSIVGKVDAERDLPVIEEYFGRIPAGPPVARDILSEGPQEGERRVSIRMAASPEVIVAYRKPNYPDPDDAPISVMAEILAGSKVSPLYTELVKRRQVATAVSNDEGPGTAYPNLLMFGASVKAPHSAADVLNAFDSVVKRFKRTGASAAQLEMAKRSIGMAYLGHLQSNESLALDFASSQLEYGTWKASVDWYDAMSKVTVADISRVANKYLTDDSRTVATIEPENQEVSR